jgi:patatin-like phospholipase/acyl hydrolase
MFKILALDGGGLRSVFQAYLIDRIEQRIGKKLQPDLIAGTSGGAIVAAAMKIMSPDEIVRKFSMGQREIFNRGGLRGQVNDLWNLEGAKYDSAGLRKFLHTIFQNLTLGSFSSRILITSFDLRYKAGWEPAVFHNFDSPKASKDLLVVDAIMRSTAAPTYFPVYQKYTDGGVWGNNPSMAAIAAAVDSMVGRIPLKEISVLSIGTGRLATNIRTAANDLGVLDWVKSGLIDLLLDGNIESSHYYSKSLLGASYKRVQLKLNEKIKIDSQKAIPTMIMEAERYDIEPIVEWMQGFWV